MSLFHPVLKCNFILYCECPLGLAYYYIIIMVNNYKRVREHAHLINVHVH